MSISRLDFLVVGAQKCGTTTLHRALAEHPEARLPLSKEAPIFDQNRLSSAEFDDYFAKYFGDRIDGRLYGKVSPQYLMSKDAISNVRVLAPAARIMVVLRDPVERAISHYMMDSRRGKAGPSLEGSLKAELTSWNGPDESRYLGGGMYGHWLDGWAETFGSEQILVVELEDFRLRTASVSLDICTHFGLSERPLSGLVDVTHKGGVERKSDALEMMRKSRAVQRLKLAVPLRYRSAIGYKVEQFNVLPSEAPEISVGLLAELRSLFATDYDRLVDGHGFVPSWPRS